MAGEEFARNWSFPEETEDQPYLHCGQCSENYMNGGHCHVAGKYQRLPREKYRGALGQCIKIGGRGA